MKMDNIVQKGLYNSILKAEENKFRSQGTVIHLMIDKKFYGNIH